MAREMGGCDIPEVKQKKMKIQKVERNQVCQILLGNGIF